MEIVENEDQGLSLSGISEEGGDTVEHTESSL